MKIKCLLYILSTLWVSFSTAQSAATKTIVVVFNNMPDYAKQIQVSPKFNIQNNDPLISYYDGYIKSDFNAKPLQVDTLRITPRCGSIRLRHSFNTIAAMDYLLQQGDTIVFNYPDGIPHASSMNSTMAVDLEYENLNRQRANLVAGFTPYEIYRTPFFTKENIDPNMIINYGQKIKAENYRLAKSLFEREKLFLDSLK